MTMIALIERWCVLSKCQDDSLRIVFVERRRISRVEGACVRFVLKGVESCWACVRFVLKGVESCNIASFELTRVTSHKMIACRCVIRSTQDLTRVKSHKMIACRCVSRTHTSDESQDDSMPMCHSNADESQDDSMPMCQNSHESQDDKQDDAHVGNNISAKYPRRIL